MPGPFEYIRPKTLPEALELLSRKGGSNLPLLFGPKPAALRQMGADTFVDLGLLGLDTIRVGADGSMKIGGLVSLQSMVESPLLQSGIFVLLGRAAAATANAGLRNLCSLWGCIQAHGGSAEVLLALLALDAEIVLVDVDQQQHQLHIVEYLEKEPRNLFKGGVVLEAVLPRCSGGWALERVVRTPRDEAITAAAACVEVKDGKTCRVTLALAGGTPTPVRIKDVEKELTGKVFDPFLLSQASRMVMEQANPQGDFRGGVEYRRSMAGLVSQRALAGAWRRASGEAAS
jgi:aerobic carbon-monoxide dehydrogenase medium subunit